MSHPPISHGNLYSCDNLALNQGQVVLSVVYRRRLATTSISNNAMGRMAPELVVLNDLIKKGRMAVRVLNKLLRLLEAAATGPYARHNKAVYPLDVVWWEAKPQAPKPKEPSQMQLVRPHLVPPLEV